MRNWKEFKIVTTDSDLLDLGIEKDRETVMSIDLNSVSAYFKTSNEKTGEEMVSVFMDAGERHDVYEEYEKFKSYLTQSIYENSI